MTPYQVVYGRQPSMLPPIAIDDGDIQEDGTSSVGNTEARIREIALQAMIEATSQARITRALRTSTRHPAARTFQKGEIVEYHQQVLRKISQVG